MSMSLFGRIFLWHHVLSVLYLHKVYGELDCEIQKNRHSLQINNSSQCGNCLEGYSEDIYDEAEQPKCIPNVKPIYYDCRCNQMVLSCPTQPEHDFASSTAVDCVVQGVYPLPTISFQVKNDLLLVPATLNVNTKCGHSPDGHGSLTVHCHLSYKDLKEIQKEITNVDLIFYMEYSSGNCSKFITHWQSEQTGTSVFSEYSHESAALKWFSLAVYIIMALLLGVFLKFCIVYFRERRQESAALNKSELLIGVESNQQKVIHPLKNKLHKYIMRL